MVHHTISCALLKPQRNGKMMYKSKVMCRKSDRTQSLSWGGKRRKKNRQKGCIFADHFTDDAYGEHRLTGSAKGGGGELRRQATRYTIKRTAFPHNRCVATVEKIIKTNAKSAIYRNPSNIAKSKIRCICSFISTFTSCNQKRGGARLVVR